MVGRPPSGATTVIPSRSPAVGGQAGRSPGPGVTRPTKEMTDDDPDTIELSDGIEVEVADVPEEARTIAVGMTISASEKVSTGDYENYEPHETVRAKFLPAIDLTQPTGRSVVRQKALELHHDLQEHLQVAVDQRLSDPDFEDWPDSVVGPTDAKEQ